MRGVTDQNTATTEVVTEVPVEEVDNITAHVPEDTLFYINESQLEVAEPENVKLLVDSIVPDEDNTLYTKAVDGFEEITSEHNVKFNYLDLVDTGNGNAYVTTAGKPITVYWPYPAGTDKMDEFHIVHYEGLDRNNNTSLADGEYDMVLYSEENGNLENTDQGIRITVESFSPFALFWEEDSGGNGGHGGNGGNKPSLNTEDHYGYIVGYPVDYETGEPTDDQARKPVKPQGKITRAEVATIFFRLLTDESRNAYWSQSNSFTDVAADAWYNNAISTMANAGILDGYEYGSFHPNGYITRAEFATIAVRFFDLSYQGEDLFPDIDGHWAQDYINQAADAGIIEGYPDGTFGPQKQITRAEAVTMVNRTLDRHPDPDHFLKDMLVWPDNLDTKAWYYADMQEATNSHEYQMKEDAQGNEYEVWTKILPIRDWEALEKEWSDANCPAMEHQPVAEVVGLLRREHPAQLHLHLHRVLGAVGEAQQAGDADAVGVRHHHAGHMEHIPQHQVGRLAAHSGQLQQLLHGAGDLSSVIPQQHLGGPHDVPGLGPEKASGVDVLFHLRHVGPGQVLQGGESGVQGGGDLVHPLVGALGRQTHGEQQLIVLFIIQGADSIGYKSLSADGQWHLNHLIHLGQETSGHSRPYYSTAIWFFRWETSIPSNFLINAGIAQSGRIFHCNFFRFLI